MLQLAVWYNKICKGMPWNELYVALVPVQLPL